MLDEKLLYEISTGIGHIRLYCNLNLSGPGL